MGKKKPLVSVVIPSYNSARYLTDTIDSVLSQKGDGILFELEIIVVDDGSTDDTQSVVGKYADRVVYRRIKNSGRPSVPRNVGARMANGEYLAFLDADDIWLPQKLSSQIATLLDNHQLLLISSNAEKIDTIGARIGGCVVSPESLPAEATLDTLINENYLCTSAVVVRRHIFIDEKGFNESLEMRAVEDYELWLRIAACGEIHFDPTPLTLYRVHIAGISNHSTLETWRLMLAVYDSFARSKRGRLSAQRKRLLDGKLFAAHRNLYMLEGIPARLRHVVSLCTIGFRLRFSENK